MPIFLLPLLSGAVLGGGAVWGISSTGQKLATTAIIGAIAFYIYKKAK